MKKLQFLIRALRQNTTIDVNSFKDELLERFFNEAQSEIRNVIFLANNDSSVLISEYLQDLTTGVTEYDLPERIFVDGSLVAVKYLTSFNRYVPLNKLSIKSIDLETGYCLVNNKLQISEGISSSKLKIIYNSDLPKMALSGGTISDITGNVLTLTDPDTDLVNKDEFVTVVDIDGEIIKSDCRIISQVGGSLTLDDVTGISNGQFVVSGAYSTTKSRLPSICEDYLIKYVERRVAIAQSAGVDINSSDLLSTEEKTSLTMIFEKKSDDVELPVISSEATWL